MRAQPTHGLDFDLPLAEWRAFTIRQGVGSEIKVRPGPLWALPNVLINPHVAGNSPAALVGIFERAGNQIRRFAAGEPLLNEVPRYQLAR